ncbi:MAG: ABC transporter permease subunit [Anaerolineales bacterium]
MTAPSLFQPTSPLQRRFTWGDALILLTLITLLYAGATLALHLTRPPAAEISISLDRRVLPLYTLYSLWRMFAAYLLSFSFTMWYGRWAAYNRRAERVLMPLLDVLQSVPILSFLPVVLISLSAILPQRIAAELSAIVLIFTSQAWNMTYAWYQSLTTIPKELREASAIFRLNSWMRFKFLELPFAAISLIWNSMMSWAGGWFFLMAAEIFTVGQREFHLPGLGAYLQMAALQGNTEALFWGLGTLILVIILMDQFIWRPLLAWADRFKIEMVESDNPPTSWFYDLWSEARLIQWVHEKIIAPLTERLDLFVIRHFPAKQYLKEETPSSNFIGRLIFFVLLLALGWGAWNALREFIQLPLAQWLEILIGLLATLVRVVVALILALSWTIPLGVLIGSQPRLAAWLQPIVQVVASIPATALFPLLVAFLVSLRGGLNLASVLLMLMGTQWYLLFNIIAGAAAIPQDLKYTASLMHLRGWERWRTLILPALFPYIITGSITASGGAWNASIVAEYIQIGGETLKVTGIGALIAEATQLGDYRLLLVATVSMILTVVLINRLFWRRLYRLAEEQYRME